MRLLTKFLIYVIVMSYVYIIGYDHITGSINFVSGLGADVLAFNSDVLVKKHYWLHLLSDKSFTTMVVCDHVMSVPNLCLNTCPVKQNCQKFLICRNNHVRKNA